jgi:hypothetical protein
MGTMAEATRRRENLLTTLPRPLVSLKAPIEAADDSRGSASKLPPPREIAEGKARAPSP